MKHYLVIVLAALSVAGLKAGNPTRSGSAGATELLINPWTRTIGWNSLNTANVSGVESFNMNIGGLTKINSTDVTLCRTNYMNNVGININAFGLGQKIGGSSYLGISMVSFNFGDIMRTTTDNPDGGIGTFSPRFNNISVGYAYAFSNAISCGIVVRGISESIADVNAQGASLDAGVQYTTKSKKDNGLKGEDVHFGISLRNVGPDMWFKGDGLARRVTDDDGIQRTMLARSATFQLPSLVNIGASYDIKLDKDPLMYHNKLVLAANFTANSFSNNQIGLGMEYGYKKILQLRGAFNYEKDIFNENTQTAFTGFAGGASINVPLKKDSENILSLDYAYRDSRVLGGTHSFGVRISLEGNKK